MEAQKKFNGAGMIKFLLVAFRAFFFLYIVVFTILVLVSSISLFSGGHLIHGDLPVTFSLIGKGNLHLSDPDVGQKFTIPYAMGIIGSDDLPTTLAVLSLLASLLMATCILFIIKTMCQILEAAKSGMFLLVENTVRLRRIALLGIATVIIEKIRTAGSSIYLSDTLEFSGVDFVGVNIFTFTNLEYIFGSLFLLVIAEAFRIGALLKQENDLTI